MKIRNEEVQKKLLKANTGSYGLKILKFAHTWADLMEPLLEAGSTFDDIARACEREADTVGMSAASYIMAVGYLSIAWEYGDALRQWHNRKYNIGSENRG